MSALTDGRPTGRPEVPARTGWTPPPPGPVPGGVLALRVLGLAGLLALVGTGALGLAQGFGTTERASSRTLPAGVTALDVGTDTGTVRVVADGRDRAEGIRVTVRERSVPGRTRVSTTVTGSGAVLHGACTGGFPATLCTVSFEVHVPDGVAVTAASDTGQVVLLGLDGTVRATADTGRVTAAGLRSRDVRATTDTGAVRLAFAVPPTKVVATADTGDVTVLVPDDGTAYRVRATVGTGAPTVTVPRDDAAARSVTATTDTGSVTVGTA